MTEGEYSMSGEEKKIQPEEFDKELELLMSSSGEHKGKKKSRKKKKISPCGLYRHRL